LEKLKQGRSARSIKDKYEVEDVENVYEEVDEAEYSEKVRERTLRDFVVDDGKSSTSTTCLH
jgi:DNA polymerase alpha subunit A